MNQDFPQGESRAHRRAWLAFPALVFVCLAATLWLPSPLEAMSSFDDTPSAHERHGADQRSTFARVETGTAVTPQLTCLEREFGGRPFRAGAPGLKAPASSAQPNRVTGSRCIGGRGAGASGTSGVNCSACGSGSAVGGGTRARR